MRSHASAVIRHANNIRHRYRYCAGVRKPTTKLTETDNAGTGRARKPLLCSDRFDLLTIHENFP